MIFIDMKLKEDISRIKRVMKILGEQVFEENGDDINLKGKIIDLENLSDEDKEILQLKERIIIDAQKNDYPIVLVQTRDGRVVMFDVNGVETNEEGM